MQHLARRLCIDDRAKQTTGKIIGRYILHQHDNIATAWQANLPSRPIGNAIAAHRKAIVSNDLTRDFQDVAFYTSTRHRTGKAPVRMNQHVRAHRTWCRFPRLDNGRERHWRAAPCLHARQNTMMICCTCLHTERPSKGFNRLLCETYLKAGASLHDDIDDRKRQGRDTGCTT